VLPGPAPPRPWTRNPSPAADGRLGCRPPLAMPPVPAPRRPRSPGRPKPRGGRGLGRHGGPFHPARHSCRPGVLDSLECADRLAERWRVSRLARSVRPAPATKPTDQVGAAAISCFAIADSRSHWRYGLSPGRRPRQSVDRCAGSVHSGLVHGHDRRRAHTAATLARSAAGRQVTTSSARGEAVTATARPCTRPSFSVSGTAGSLWPGG